MALDLDLACHLNVVVPDASPANLDRALPPLADLGYRRVVLPPLDPATTDVGPIRDAFRAAGLSPVTIAGQGPGADVSSDDADERAAGAEALRQQLALIVALGGDQLNGVPYGLFGPPAGPSSRAAFERSAAEVGRVADLAAEQGVLMTFEVLNRYETSLLNTAAQALEFVVLSGSSNLRIHLDTFHMAVEEDDMVTAIMAAMPSLGYLELGQSGRGSLGSGAVDVPSLVQRVTAAGYAGRWGIEAFSRSVLAPEAAEMLNIWRSPYDDGLRLAREAVALIEGALTEQP